MTRPTHPSIPPSAPAPFRHLGRGTRDRSIRVQVSIALVAGLVMVAVPLYLWRRPVLLEAIEVTARVSSSSNGSTQAIGVSPLVPEPTGSAVQPTNVTLPLASSAPAITVSSRGLSLGEAKVVKCSKAGVRGGVGPCDRQPFFEEALARVIRDSSSCAPTLTAGGTVNFVLEVDFYSKKLRVWPGRSGSIRKKALQDVVGCINRALPTPDWSQLPHQYTKYQVALLATVSP